MLWWRLLGVLPLASGAALLVHVLAHASLGLALLGGAVICFTAIRLCWNRLTPAARVELVRRVKAGLVAGLLATLAYDLARWVIVTLFHDTFWPFDIYPIFGRAIAGAGLSTHAAIAIGLLYHYTNGLCFAVAYAVVLAPRGWWTGVLWALGLEAMMLTIYPGWLDPRPFQEFVSVSMLGHFTYGSVLGVASRRLLAKPWRMGRTMA